MSLIFVAAGIAAGSPLALLSLAYLAAAAAYRQQALQDQESARLWNRPPARRQPIAPALVVYPTPRRRAPVLATCSTLPKGAANPRASRDTKKRAAR
jgi:hypothetical protein